MTSQKLFNTLEAEQWHWLVAESPRKSALARSLVQPVTGRYAKNPTKSQCNFKHVILEGDDAPARRPEAMV